MKTTIFARILTATLLPLVLISSLVIFTINRVIYSSATSLIKERTEQLSKQASGQITHKLESMSIALQLASTALSGMDPQSPETVRTAGVLMKTLLASDPTFYRARLAFEADAAHGGERYYKAVVRNGTELKEYASDGADGQEQLELALCHTFPLSTGKVLVNLMEHRSLSADAEPRLAGAMTYPIFSDGKVIGCIGLDIQYKDMLAPALVPFEGPYKLLLLSQEGAVLYSAEYQEVGRQLLDKPFQHHGELANAMRRGASFLAEDASPFFEKKALIGLYPILIAPAKQTLYLYLDMPLESLNTSVNASIQLIVVTGALGLTLLICSIFFVTRNIAKPIKRLTENFTRAAGGDLDQAFDDAGAGPPEPTNTVELQSLQCALQMMLEQVARVHDLNLKAAQSEVEKEKILAASEAKNRFFANVSHEIRTPMNAVLGISEILLHDASLSDHQKKYVADIKMSSDALMSVINDILDLSKLESGKMPLIPVHFNLPATLENIVTLAAYLAAEKGLRFEYEPQGEIPLYLYADDIRLRQVLLNILSNAVKFTAKGSVVLRVAAEAEVLRFSVTDTGCGIQEEDLPMLFEPFTQLDLAQNRHVQGTGLGLSICKNLLELMGGSISVTSRYGEGSIFSFTIPKILGNETEIRKGTAEGELCYIEPPRVLIVDDDEINLNVAAGLLHTLYGISAEMALSGPDALEKAREKTYDLIFMDHMMPEMDGIETLKKLRALGGDYQSVPVVALTANAMNGARELLESSGMDDFLVKPIRKEELEKVLTRWLREENLEHSRAGRESIALSSGGEYSGVLAKLAGTGFLDVSAGLESAAGQKDAYEQSLRLLCDKIPRLTRLANDTLSKGALDIFSIHIHGMKGSLASVGAQALSAEAGELERASVEGDVPRCRAALPGFIRRLEEMNRQLEDALRGRGARGGKASAAKGDLANAAQQLHHALTQHDYELVTEALRHFLGLDYGAAANAVADVIKNHVDRFEYDAARAVLSASFSAHLRENRQ